MAADVVSHNTVIDAYAKQGDVAGAERALARMEQKGVAANVVSHSTLVDTHAKKGDTVGAAHALAGASQFIVN